MLINTINTIFERDLNRLKTEIELYTNENNLWQMEKGISNSAGNLCLHLIGNLNMFIGNVLGKTDYVRNRPLEFSLKNIPRANLLQSIDATIVMVDRTLNALREEDLQLEFPLLVFEKKTSTEFMLIHLTTHLSYHLGQINYHRRLLDN